MFLLDPHSLSDARLQLHWATQLLCAAADATFDPLPDDSHSNLGWDSASFSLVGRSGVRLKVMTLELTAPGQPTMSLNAKTLEDARKWLSQQIGKELKFRDYEMPSHGVANGELFDVDANRLGEIAMWFGFGYPLMESLGENRVWPHHLDMGWQQPIENVEGSIGGGLSPGDEHYDQPYFYINPYGADFPENRPKLTCGQWANTWNGAVLTADEILKIDSEHHDERKKLVSRFFDETMNLFRGWYA